LNHRGLAGIAEIVIDIVPDKIEECCQLRESNSFGVRFVVHGQVVQKFQDGF
jgi:hypothetical protein